MLYRGMQITAETIGRRVIGYRVVALRQGYATLGAAKSGIRSALWLRRNANRAA